MTQRPDLNTLSKEVFEANKAKGFHDMEVSNETLLMLVITELSEAVEADRKGKRANIGCFNVFSDYNRPAGDAFSFESTIKDTVEDELADAVIRLLDLAGLRGIVIDQDLDRYKVILSQEPFSEMIFFIVDAVCRFNLILSDKYPIHIRYIIFCIEHICEYLSNRPLATRLS